MRNKWGKSILSCFFILTLVAALGLSCGGGDEPTPTPTPIGVSALFAATPELGTAPLQVQFTDESTGQITAWAWDLGDGATSTARNPLHTYNDAGNYTVSLTVTGADGATDTEAKADFIRVGDLLAGFSASPTTGAPSLQVQFTDESVGEITAWEWDFDNNGTVDSTGQNPSYTYDAMGKYSVALKVTGPVGSDTFIRGDYIMVTEREDLEVRIGLSYPLSGPYAGMGLNFLRIWEMAIEDVNEAGYMTADGKVIKIKPYIADNAFQSSLAAASAIKFVDEDKVHVMSFCGTGSSLAAQPIAEAAGVLLMASGTAASLLGPDKPYTFVTGANIENIPNFTKWLLQDLELEIDTVSIVLTDTSASSAVATGILVPTLDYFDLQLLDTEYYASDTVDFYPIINRILPDNPDAIWCSMSTPGFELIKQLWERGYRGYFLAALGAPPGDVSGLVEGVEELLSNCYFPIVNPTSPLCPAGMNDFSERYEERYGELPMGIGLHYYVEPFIVAQAVAEAGGVDDLMNVVDVMEAGVFNTAWGEASFGAEELYGIKRALVDPGFYNTFDQDGLTVTLNVVSPLDAITFCAEVLASGGG